MESDTYSSPIIAQEMQNIYGEQTSIVQVEMRHEEEITNYITHIEEAHEKAATSDLSFH